MAISLFLMGVWDGLHCHAVLSFIKPGRGAELNKVPEVRWEETSPTEVWQRCVLTHCWIHKNVYWCVFSLAGNKVTKWEHTQAKFKKKEASERELSPEAKLCLHLDCVIQASGAHTNCIHFSIYIIQLAGGSFFIQTLWLGTDRVASTTPEVPSGPQQNGFSFPPRIFSSRWFLIKPPPSSPLWLLLSDHESFAFSLLVV